MCQLQTGTCQEHLIAIEQEGHLPSASAGTEPCAAAAGDPSTPPKGTQGRKRDTVLQGNWVFRYFQELIS